MDNNILCPSCGKSSEKEFKFDKKCKPCKGKKTITCAVCNKSFMQEEFYHKTCSSCRHKQKIDSDRALSLQIQMEKKKEEEQKEKEEEEKKSLELYRRQQQLNEERKAQKQKDSSEFRSNATFDYVKGASQYDIDSLTKLKLLKGGDVVLQFKKIDHWSGEKISREYHFRCSQFRNLPQGAYVEKFLGFEDDEEDEMLDPTLSEKLLIHLYNCSRCLNAFDAVENDHIDCVERLLDIFGLVYWNSERKNGYDLVDYCTSHSRENIKKFLEEQGL